MQRSHLLFLITICLAVSCIYTTYYGFFLVMQKFSEISKVNLVDEGNKSWFDQKGKVIMIVVDAFRFDFLTYNETIEGHESYTYQNRLKKMHKLLKTSPESFTVLRARADFPTWTIAKVPGMVTGNIYPKTGMFQAMAASRSIEDNVPKQATLAGKIALFRGDPLWRDYFPEDFKDITSVRGYDIKNSNIDDEIKAEVRAFIKENNFDLLISHLLSLDHTAHSVGLYDEKVGEQLGIVDDWLAEVIDMMDDNTTLIILGDHGMNLLGSHGTDTPEETNTVIAGYHKLGFQKYRDNITSPVMRSINETPLQLKQQDLASTLAMLVGVPIPFSNVGQIINDMYPAGQFEDPPGCEGRAFLTKILNDNYLNTAQIKHYYDFFNEKTELLSAELQKNMTSSAEEAISAYKEAIAMTKNGQQCQESFVDKSTKAILLGQKFSNIVYRAILTNKDYNMAVILQGLASMVLIIICYILQVQHFYSHAYERQYDELKIDMTLFKSLIIPTVALLGIFLVTFLINGRFVHFLTSATVFLNLWLVINLFVYNFRTSSHGTLQHCTRFLNGAKHEDIKQQELDHIPLDATEKSEREGESQKGDQEADDVFTDIDSQIEQGKKGGFWAGLKSLFIFKTPVVSISALMFTVATVYCLQASIFESFIENYAKDYSPFVVLLLIGFRISSPFSATIFYLIMAANMIVVVIIAKSDLIDPQSLKLRILFGLILMADFVAAEIRHIIARMGAHVIWGCGQLLCFLVVAVYQMIDERSIFLVEIVLPRIVWALIICLCVFKNVFLISGRASLRNLQLCLVQFLLLLQGQKDVIPFAMTLTLMRITTYLVSRYSKPSNYLFPFIMVLETYFGFFFLGQTDRTFPATYNAGFVGLHDFNMVLSGPMIVLALLSGFVLGGLFVSYYNQYIQAHYHVGSEAVSDKTNWRITARVIKKRNIVFFVFLVCIVHFGAYLKCLAWRKEFLLLEEARYKYIVDGFIYIVVMGWVALVLAFE